MKLPFTYRPSGPEERMGGGGGGGGRGGGRGLTGAPRYTTLSLQASCH